MRKAHFLLLAGTLLILLVSGWIFFIGRNDSDTGDVVIPTGKQTPVQPTGDLGEVPSPTGVNQKTYFNIYMVALEDNGTGGKKIGCGDSLIPVKREIDREQGVLTAALTDQLSQKEQYYGESGLYNALYRSSLTLEKATITNGVADIRISGKLSLGGVCDDPRVEEMLNGVALQFPTIRQANILLNGVPLHDALSEK